MQLFFGLLSPIYRQLKHDFFLIIRNYPKNPGENRGFLDYWIRDNSLAAIGRLI